MPFPEVKSKQEIGFLEQDSQPIQAWALMEIFISNWEIKTIFSLKERNKINYSIPLGRKECESRK